MLNEAKLVALIGSSGIGKGFLKARIQEEFGSTFSQPRVFTTRPSRIDDLSNCKISLTKYQFDLGVENGEIIYPHKIFNKLDYEYGFAALDFKYQHDKFLLLELHPKTINNFRLDYQNNLLAIALLASKGILEKNLIKRGTDDLNSIKSRLDYVELEQSQTIQAYQDGYIDELLELDRFSDYTCLTIAVFGLINNFLKENR